jgi:L-histidine Nalpha-methyltransferase
LSWSRVPASAPPSADRVLNRFAEDVQYYLTQQPRQLPSRYLYDELGSALFEAICRLPWYSITRAEQQLLTRHAAEILRRAAPSRIIELGSGSGEKLKRLLEATDERQALHVHLVDVSRAALDQASRALAILDGIAVTLHERTYEAGLEEAARAFASTDRALALFLGSNLGNFDPPSCKAFLRDVRRELRPGDFFLVGADLIKSEGELLLAYDDPLGVTAAFNRNLLVRVNRELEADFDVEQFAHRAAWNPEASRVEMHLIARSQQTIRVRRADLSLTMSPGEHIWTESSYKYQPDELRRLLAGSGFGIAVEWMHETAGFALTLAEAC